MACRIAAVTAACSSSVRSIVGMAKAGCDQKIGARSSRHEQNISWSNRRANAAWKRISDSVLRRLPGAQRDSVMAGTAMRVYRLD
jgi:hypothetical protein